MDYDVVADIFSRLTFLAFKCQQPLIILENPKCQSVDPQGRRYTNRYILTIGNASVLFNGFTQVEMIEVYAEIKAQLDIEAAFMASNKDKQDAKST